MSLWIAQVERTLSEEVAGSPDDVRDFYVNLDNIKVVHPLVVAIRSVERRRTTDGYVHTYRVTDSIPLGPLRVRANYVATLHVPVSGDVLTEARQFPCVRLSGTVAFAPVGTSTRLTERIRIEAPRPLASITVRKALAAHAEMLAGIRRHFACEVR